MNIERLPELAGVGATAVLYLLIVLSIAQLAVILERAITFFTSRGAKSDTARVLAQALAAGDIALVHSGLRGQRSSAARIIASGAAHAKSGAEAVEEIMKAELLVERQRLESRLPFLGTLGNNAPFIGLFGTVLGIIHAFADLAAQANAQASRAVMAGISEALIATAVGLLVALPAVVAYNAYMRAIKNRLVDAESLGGKLIAHLKSAA